MKETDQLKKLMEAMGKFETYEGRPIREADSTDNEQILRNGVRAIAKQLIHWAEKDDLDSYYAMEIMLDEIKKIVNKAGYSDDGWDDEYENERL